ncbi:MAG: YdjY domain-containing protein [Limisphaerales bacterium]
MRFYRLGWLLLLPFCVGGAELPPQPKETPPPKIRELKPGEWQVGDIRLSKNQRSITFPANVNITNGLVEYLLVHRTGKTHESIFSTRVPPYHIQVAMLLLGAKGVDVSFFTNAPPSGPVSNADLYLDKTPPIPGQPVEVSAQWKRDGTNVTHRMETLLYNKKAKQFMQPGPWTFSGSVVWDGVFIAQIEGSIMSIVTDAGAVFNSPHPERDRDSAWLVREELLPPEQWPATITVKVLKNPETKATKPRP